MKNVVIQCIYLIVFIIGNTASCYAKKNSFDQDYLNYCIEILNKQYDHNQELRLANKNADVNYVVDFRNEQTKKVFPLNASEVAEAQSILKTYNTGADSKADVYIIISTYYDFVHNLSNIFSPELYDLTFDEKVAMMDAEKYYQSNDFAQRLIAGSKLGSSAKKAIVLQYTLTISFEYFYWFDNITIDQRFPNSLQIGLINYLRSATNSYVYSDPGNGVDFTAFMAENAGHIVSFLNATEMYATNSDQVENPLGSDLRTIKISKSDPRYAFYLNLIDHPIYNGSANSNHIDDYTGIVLENKALIEETCNNMAITFHSYITSSGSLGPMNKTATLLANEYHILHTADRTVLGIHILKDQADDIIVQLVYYLPDNLIYAESIIITTAINDFMQGKIPLQVVIPFIAEFLINYNTLFNIENGSLIISPKFYALDQHPSIAIIAGIVECLYAGGKSIYDIVKFSFRFHLDGVYRAKVMNDLAYVYNNFGVVADQVYQGALEYDRTIEGQDKESLKAFGSTICGAASVFIPGIGVEEVIAATAIKVSVKILGAAGKYFVKAARIAGKNIRLSVTVSASISDIVRAKKIISDYASDIASTSSSVKLYVSNDGQYNLFTTANMEVVVAKVTTAETVDVIGFQTNKLINDSNIDEFWEAFQGITNASANSVRNALTSSIINGAKKYFIDGVEVGSADISSNGYIGFDIRIPSNLQKQGYATEIFADAINYYKSQNKTINGIKSMWLSNNSYEGGMSTNLRSFIDDYLYNGKSFSEAALNTPTGKIAAKNGFTKVVKGEWDVLELGDGKPAQIYWMELKFIKP